MQRRSVVLAWLLIITICDISAEVAWSWKDDRSADFFFFDNIASEIDDVKSFKEECDKGYEANCCATALGGRVGFVGGDDGLRGAERFHFVLFFALNVCFGDGWEGRLSYPLLLFASFGKTVYVLEQRSPGMSRRHKKNYFFSFSDQPRSIQPLTPQRYTQPD